MGVERVFFMEAGFVTVDTRLLYGTVHSGEKLCVPCYMVLLKIAREWILIDTGLNPLGIRDPQKAFGLRAESMTPLVRPEDDVRQRLFGVGLSVGQIKTVINTHLHWDHCGGNPFFEQATFYIQKAEAHAAWNPENVAEGPYMRNQYDCGLKYELLEGDTVLRPGLSVITTPGHTPGHQSLLLELNSGRKLLLTGDAAYTNKNVEELQVPGVCWDPVQALESLQRIKALQATTGALVYPAHDPYLWRSIPHSPDYVD